MFDKSSLRKTISLLHEVFYNTHLMYPTKSLIEFISGKIHVPQGSDLPDASLACESNKLNIPFELYK